MSLVGTARAGAGVARMMGAEGFRLGRDELARSSRLPRTVDELDAPVMARVLGTPVHAVRRLSGACGTTDRVRLAVDGPDAPESVFAKLPPSARGVRYCGNLARLGATEVGFYRDVRPVADVAAPRVLGQQFDGRTGRYLLVLEDLAGRGCAFRDVLDSFTAREARAAVETLARLHASLAAEHRRDLSGRWPWLTTLSDDRLTVAMAPTLRYLAHRVGRRCAELVPDGFAGVASRYPAVARGLDRGPHTVLHGDPHPGNWYLDGEVAGLLDWQATRIGNPLRDVAYFLVLALEREARQDTERELLRTYGEVLAARGGPLLDDAAMWDAYRAMAVYPYVAALFTAGLGGMQPDHVADAGLRRAAAAVRDLGAIDALGRWMR